MEPVTFLIASLLALFTALIYYPQLKKSNEIASIVNKIPGPRSFPIIGSTYEILIVTREKLFDVINKSWDDYPDIQRSWVGSKPEVRIAKAEYVEKIMSSTKHLEKSYGYDFIKPWLGDGLLIAKGDRWHSHRKIITPAFHFSILDGFCDVFAEQANVLVGKLEKYADGKQAIDVCPFVTRAALDIICETAMGTKINAQGGSHSEYVDAIYEISELAIKRIFRPWLHSDFIYSLTENGKKFEKDLSILHGFTGRVIEERKRERINKRNKMEEVKEAETDDVGKKKRMAFLDILLEAIDQGKNLSMDDLRQEVDTFMFEGHDTTTSGISWSLFCIGNNPDIQQQIVEEMETIFGDSDRSATIKDLNEMKYLERVVKETMRLFPPVPIIGRITSEDVEIGGYQIPKDCFISIEIYKIMRDPKHFPNPMKFDPDRFLKENTNTRHPYAYIPFSAGPRNCIGQKFALLEELGVISSVIRKYKVQSLQKPEDLTMMAELILRANEGLKVTLQKR